MVRVINPNGKFEKKLVNRRNKCQLGLGLVTLMIGQRSKVTNLLYIITLTDNCILYNCQLGLGLGLTCMRTASFYISYVYRFQDTCLLFHSAPPFSMIVVL